MGDTKVLNSSTKTLSLGSIKARACEARPGLAPRKVAHQHQPLCPNTVARAILGIQELGGWGGGLEAFTDKSFCLLSLGTLARKSGPPGGLGDQLFHFDGGFSSGSFNGQAGQVFSQRGLGPGFGKVSQTNCFQSSGRGESPLPGSGLGLW